MDQKRHSSALWLEQKRQFLGYVSALTSAFVLKPMILTLAPYFYILFPFLQSLLSSLKDLSYVVFLKLSS